jgi:hypothetical protein
MADIALGNYKKPEFNGKLERDSGTTVGRTRLT